MDKISVYDLLGTRDIPGSEKQIRALETRLSELVAINGRKWVLDHRAELLKQWEMALNFESRTSRERGRRKDMEEKKRLHVIIKGRVQGVCYRLETQKAARRYGVNGWVRNLQDGSVEAMFEGDAGAVDDLVQWCRRGPSLAVVTDLEIEPLEYKGEFKGFEIRF